MKKKAFIVFGIIYAIGIGVGITAMITQNVGKKRSSTIEPMSAIPGIAKNTIIGYISMDGPIFFSAEDNSPFWSAERGAKLWISQLDIAATNNNIKAVILRINSPGGTVGASQELNNAVKRIRDAGKPVVVSVADISASGGYYTAVAASRIFVNAGSLIGSIGVIMSGFDASELIKKIGIKYTAVTSGANKDLGSPFKAMTTNQQQLLQDLIMNTYEQFLSAVALGRGKSIDEMRPLADGRVFTGLQAVENGLADEVGDLKAVESYVRKEYNLENAVLAPISASVPFKLQNLLSVFTPKSPKVQLLPENEFGSSPLLYLFSL